MKNRIQLNLKCYLIKPQKGQHVETVKINQINVMKSNMIHMIST